VFVENSGVDISGIFQSAILSARLELITYTEKKDVISLGKGIGETRIIARALEYSRFIRDADFIFKITGRLIIKNISHFLTSPQLDDQQVIAMSDLEKGFTLSAFFIFKPSFFTNHFLAYSAHLDDTKGFYFEHALTYAIYDVIKTGKKFESFDLLPRLAGDSGTQNKKLKSGYLYWALTNRIFLAWKFKKKQLARRLTL
jgi:hypothetical protein